MKRAYDYFLSGNEKSSVANRDYYAAIQDYNKAIELDPLYILAYLKRGKVKKWVKDYRGALADLTKAIELDPMEISAFWYRASVKVKLNDYEGAISDINKIISEKANYKDYHHQRGKIYYKIGNYEGALDDFNKVLEIDPGYEPCYYDRGYIKYILGDYDGAINDYKKVLEVDVDFPYTFSSYVSNIKYDELRLSDYLINVTNCSLAILELDSNIEWTYYDIGVAKHIIGDYRGAIECYDREIKNNPTNADAYYRRGEAKGEIGDGDGEEIDYAHSKAVDNSLYEDRINCRGLAKRAIDKFIIGDKEGAIDFCNKALENDPFDPEAYNSLGVIQASLGNHIEAIDAFSKAIIIRPKCLKSYCGRGVSRKILSDFKGALADFNKAIELDSKFAKAYQYRSLVKELLGLKDEAIADRRTAEKLGL